MYYCYIPKDLRPATYRLLLSNPLTLKSHCANLPSFKLIGYYP